MGPITYFYNTGKHCLASELAATTKRLQMLADVERFHPDHRKLVKVERGEGGSDYFLPSSQFFFSLSFH